MSTRANVVRACGKRSMTRRKLMRLFRAEGERQTNFQLIKWALLLFPPSAVLFTASHKTSEKGLSPKGVKVKFILHIFPVIQRGLFLHQLFSLATLLLLFLLGLRHLSPKSFKFGFIPGITPDQYHVICLTVFSEE